jgi:hypothetical protein
MCEVNPEYRLILKPEGLLTRDPRMVERKKSGQKKARKKFQPRRNILSVLNTFIQDLLILLNLKQCCCCPEVGISLASKCI